MQELHFVGQLVLAILLGGLVGWQRNRWGKSAGMRTYALVTAGAALFTILSVHSFNPGDVTRVASHIVTGIGFLGAGLIMQRGHHVEGLTTAAGLWMTAGVGMAVGVGMYVLAIGAAAVMFLVLMLDDTEIKK
jgi:putative Mg2+ transporter-C (MgtC) family protein